MLKALLKKQFLELNSFYFQDKKTGRRRSKLGTVLHILLFVFIFICLCGIFYTVAMAFAPLLDTEMSWLYFCLMGMLAIAYGTLGSAFNTYTGLYHAKDNDLLLSMPIPPSKILFVRILGVVAMGLLYEVMLMIPTLLVRFLAAPIGVAGVVCSLVMVFVIAVFVTVLSCLLGWVVALLSSKFKNKSFLPVLFSLVFLGVYYYFFSRSYSLLQALYAQSQAVGNAIRTWLYPFYLMGRGAEGDLPSMLLFSAGVGVLLALTYFILSKTFIRITTKLESGTKPVYRERQTKAASPDRALLRKELKRFTSSPTYMLNCSLGTVLMPAVAILALIYRFQVREALLLFTGMGEFLPIAAGALICAMTAVNDITAPSISLEGKNLWILQSMPIPTSKIFDAKQKLHCALTMPPALILTVCLATVLQLEFYTALLLAIFVMLFIMFSSAAGLALNLRLPNLNWTNETAPTKQSMVVFIAIFGGWLIAILFAAGGYFLTTKLSGTQFLLICIVLLALLSRLLNGWLRKTGVRILESL